MKRFRQVILATITAACCASISSAAEYGYHPASPLYLGGTFNPLDLTEPKPDCIDWTQSEKVSVDRYESSASSKYATKTSFVLDKVETREKLYKYLHVSASVSGQYALFSAAASFELEDEHMFSSDSFTWIVSGYSNFGRFRLKTIKLTPEAQSLSSDPYSFRQRCGTHFVVQETRGVVIAAVFTVQNVSQEDKHKLETALTASYSSPGLGGISGSAHFQEIFQYAFASNVVHIQLFTIGGAGVSSLASIATDFNDIQAVLDTIQDYLSNQVLETSVSEDFLTAPLDTLLGAQALTEPDFGIFDRSIEELFFLDRAYETDRDNIRRVLLAPSLFGLQEGDTALKDIQNAYVKRLEDIEKIRTIALACRTEQADVADKGQQPSNPLSFTPKAKEAPRLRKLAKGGTDDPDSKRLREACKPSIDLVRFYPTPLPGPLPFVTSYFDLNTLFPERALTVVVFGTESLRTVELRSANNDLIATGAVVRDPKDGSRKAYLTVGEQNIKSAFPLKLVIVDRWNGHSRVTERQIDSTGTVQD